MNKMQNKE